MSGIFHSGGFDPPPPMLSGKYPCYFFGVWNPFISTFRAFLDFTLIKVDEVGGGGVGGVGEEVSGWFPLRHILFISFPSLIRLCLRSKY